CAVCPATWPVSQSPEREARSGPPGVCTLNCGLLLAQDAGRTTIASLVLSMTASTSDRSCFGTSNLSSVWLRSSMKASHSSALIRRCRWDSSIDRPEYRCGPPLASPSCSVTKYLHPAATRGGVHRRHEDSHSTGRRPCS